MSMSLQSQLAVEVEESAAPVKLRAAVMLYPFVSHTLRASTTDLLLQASPGGPRCASCHPQRHHGAIRYLLLRAASLLAAAHAHDDSHLLRSTGLGRETRPQSAVQTLPVPLVSLRSEKMLFDE